MNTTALITGAYRGLGLEAARQLLAKGVEVILTARKADVGEKAAALLRQQSKGKVHFVTMNVLEDESIAAAVDAVSKQVGHLDILINNAAIFPDPSKSILDTPQTMLLDAYDTNTVGPIRVTRAFVPLLQKANPGPARIVNISSGLGALRDMQNACTAYGLSKTALNGVTRQLAAALKESNILVNSVCPGWCRTEMGGKDATRSVEEGATGIVWTATEVLQTGGFYRDNQPIDW